MKILKNILLGLGIILLLLIIVSFFLPSKVHVERSKVIGATPDVVFSHIKDLKKWGAWSPWEKKDSTMTSTYEGPDGEVGQKSTWKSEKMGEGSMQITESVPNEKLVTALDFGGKGGGSGTFVLEPVGADSTKVTWSMDSDGEGIPWYMKPMSKYFNLMMDKFVGADFEEGLTDLKVLAESTPKQPEMPQYDVQEVTTEKQMVLVAPKKRMKVEETQEYFGKHFPELYGFALQSNVKPGSAAAMYYYWDGKETEAEALLPVDKEPKNLGGYTFRTMEPTQALLVDYHGAYEGLGGPHNAIEAYSKEKNLTLGYPWEVYVTDPSTEPDTSKWLTKVYYPIMPADAESTPQ